MDFIFLDLAIEFCLELGNWDLELLGLPQFKDSRQVVRLLKVRQN